jgi:type VI secretion system protein ImpH
VGIGLPTLQDRDALPDSSRLHFAGRLSRQTRDAEGLLAWCRSEFGVPVSIEQWCGHWLTLADSERSRLGQRGGAVLGRSAVLGSKVWDVQHKFRIALGPLELDQYMRFLPGGADLPRLQALVRSWVGIEFAWDLKLVLMRDEVPTSNLSARGLPLGHASWLGHVRRSRDAGDLCIDVERSCAPKATRTGLPAEADVSVWPSQGATAQA